MKTILTVTTPYSLGDKVWIIKDGVPTEVEITGLSAYVSKERSVNVLYSHAGGSKLAEEIFATQHEALTRLNSQPSVTIEEQA